MDILTKIDWRLLAEQRRVIAEITAELAKVTAAEPFPLPVLEQRIDALDGVANLLYELAAGAVDSGLVTEEEAFLSAE